jgi:TolB-like protein
MPNVTMHQVFLTMLLCGMILLLTGCGSGVATKSFMREGASLAHIERVVVLPYENLGGGGEKRIREITMTQLLASGMFDVVDKGRVDSVLRDEALAPETPFDEATLRRLGQRLNAQAFILGSVESSTESRGSSSYPEIVMTLRLIDSETGTLLWQASGRGSGYTLSDRLFGFAPKNSFQVTLELLTRLLKTLR